MKPLTHPPPCLEPTIIKRFDHTNLCPELRGLRLNASLIAWAGGYRLAYRSGWKGSVIVLVALDDNLEPLWWHELDIQHKQCSYAREDPRLFIHRGRLHVSLCGVVSGGKRATYTNVLYARLDADEKVEEVFYPEYIQRTHWEKNWGFFSHNGVLYASYSIAPHRVLAIDGNRAELAHETTSPFAWAGGEPRGGASPILYNGLYHSFFHARWNERPHTYHAGLATFQAEPPFLITGMSTHPIWIADSTMRPSRGRPSVVFPAGAVFRNRHWLVSAGIHDRHVEIAQYDQSSLALYMGKRWTSKESAELRGEWYLPERFLLDEEALIVGLDGPTADDIASRCGQSQHVNVVSPSYAVPQYDGDDVSHWTQKIANPNYQKLDDILCREFEYAYLDIGSPWYVLAGCGNLRMIRRMIVTFGWNDDANALANVIGGRGFNTRIVYQLADRGCIIAEREEQEDVDKRKEAAIKGKHLHALKLARRRRKRNKARSEKHAAT